ncbi:hypothetical protein D3C77_464140 [compost metagenome]
MNVQGPAKVRNEACAQCPITEREVGGCLGPGHAKAQFAAVGGGDIDAHHVVDVLLAAVHLEVRVLLPLRRGHDVVDGDHLVQRLTAEGRMGLGVGHVDDLAFALDVAGDDHHAHVGLVGNAQNQGDVIGLERLAQVLEGVRHGPGIEGAIIDVANQAVVAGKVQAQLGQCGVSQHGIFHSRLLARVRPGGLPLLFLLFRPGSRASPPPPPL